VYGPKATLAPSVVAHAAVDFASREATGTTVTLTRLATAPGGPGRAFKLPEAALYEALVAASVHIDEIEVTSPGGIRQIAVRSDDPDLAMSILESYYERTAGSVRRLSDRPVINVLREYEQVLRDLDAEDDRIQELELRQRRITLAQELASVGVSV
jgi:hypothetical protein